MFEYQHLLLFRDIWWPKFYSVFKCCSFFSTPVLIRHLWQLNIVVFLHWCLIDTVLLLGLCWPQEKKFKPKSSKYLWLKVEFKKCPDFEDKNWSVHQRQITLKVATKWVMMFKELCLIFKCLSFIALISCIHIFVNVFTYIFYQVKCTVFSLKMMLKYCLRTLLRR